MAEKKSSGFRFRLPWLLQPSLASRTAEPPNQPQRTTTQTSTSAQRPPFRPPGKAPAPPPPPPASPKRSLVLVASSPPKSPESAIAKTPDPVETLPAEETQTATETIPTGETANLTSPTEAGKTDLETQQTTETSSPRTETPPEIAEVIDAVETQPTKETQTTDETIQTIETPRPITPPSPPKAPSPPKSFPPQTNSQPNSPSRMPAQSQSNVQTKPSPPSVGFAQTQAASQTNTPPRSPSRSASPPKDKTSSPEIKRSTQMPHLSLDAKPKDVVTNVKGSQTKSKNPYSKDLIHETKSHKTKQAIAARLPLHKEIKDDISKFVHKIATSPSKQHTDHEKPETIITLAGDNKGASMHLNLEDANGKKSEKDSKTGENQETKAIVNSNVQGINNSMMLNTSVKERNPGVHVVFSQNISNTNDSKIKKIESMDMHKAEADVTPPERIVYNPIFGSSHGGVFMDPNESDRDDNEIEVL